MASGRSRKRNEVYAPFALGSAFRFSLLAGELYRYLTPDRHFHVALQHHVAAENCGQAHLSPNQHRQRQHDDWSEPPGSDYVPYFHLVIIKVHSSASLTNTAADDRVGWSIGVRLRTAFMDDVWTAVPCLTMLCRIDAINTTSRGRNGE